MRRSWLLLSGALCVLASGPAIAGPVAADFGRAAPSGDTRRLADWVVRSGDAHGRPFIIVDKIGARVFAFALDGTLRGETPALLGLAKGDVSPPGIGDRKLADIGPADRITPAGRFDAAMGRNLAQDILWVDYDAAISLHRVATGNAKEHRLARLATETTSDNRVSYGCINVPTAFYETIVGPLFRPANGVVYVLPETRPFGELFAAALQPPP